MLKQGGFANYPQFFSEYVVLAILNKGEKSLQDISRKAITVIRAGYLDEARIFLALNDLVKSKQIETHMVITSAGTEEQRYKITSFGLLYFRTMLKEFSDIFECFRGLHY